MDPLATVPTIGHEGEDLGYDIYALRIQHQHINPDGTPALFPQPQAGYPTRVDLQGKIVKPIRIEAGRPFVLGTGISIHFKHSDSTRKFGFLMRDRSSMASKGIFVSGGVIDSGYRGEIKVILNLATGSYQDIYPGEKIAQLIPIEVFTDKVEVLKESEELEESEREEAGFGSTGV